MMKDNRLRGIIALAVVTVLAFGLIYGSRFFTRENEQPGQNGEPIAGGIDVTGFSGVREARELVDDNGNVIGYEVTTAAPGFITDIVMRTTFEADARTISGLAIVSHSETPGYGAVIADTNFLDKFPGLVAPVHLEGDAPAAGTAETAPIAQNTTDIIDAQNMPALNDGTYTAEATEFGGTGYKDVVTLTVSNGNITSVVWDAYTEAGEYKSILSENGTYVMTETGPTWNEQAKAMAAFVIERQSTEPIVMNESGKTDSVAGVSISVSSFVALVENALSQAAGIPPHATLKDGVYRVESDIFVNGYKNMLTMVVTDGRITSVVWDAMDEKGEYKSYLSAAGKYIMVEGNPTWKEQADALAAYVVENQSTQGISFDDNGKTDTIAGVSININDFLAKVGEAIQLATAGDGTVVAIPQNPVTPSTGAVNSQVDAISGATATSRGIVDGINKAYDFISAYVNR